jgi:hypothetical protein
VVTIRLLAPATSNPGGDATPLPFVQLARYRAAALRARRDYPGPLGELLQRELTAYADFGYRLSSDSLIDRLAAQILQPGGGRGAGPP